jgi:hypothetical protein
MCLWCCWKDLDGQDLMEFIWIQNVGDIDFKVVSAAEIQVNSKKSVFGRKNQLRTW